MNSNTKEQNPTSEKPEHLVDKAVEDSFPASDAPATGGITRIEKDDEAHNANDKPDNEPDEKRSSGQKQ
jgi:hypothetical protein